MIFNAVGSIPIKLSLEKRIAPQLVALDAYYDTFPVIGLQVVGSRMQDAPGFAAFSPPLEDAPAGGLAVLASPSDTVGGLQAEGPEPLPPVDGLAATQSPDAGSGATGITAADEPKDAKAQGTQAAEPLPPPAGVEGLTAGRDELPPPPDGLTATCTEEKDNDVEGLVAEDEGDV